MSNLVLAAAQYSAEPGDIEMNVSKHVQFSRAAWEYGAELVLFPELSLTGYELELAEECAITAFDSILDPLVDLSSETGITIIAGCPVQSDSTKPYLGALIFQPMQETVVYRKQYVHSTEEPYFISGNGSVVCNCGDEIVGIAVCFDINHEFHAAAAKQLGCTVYTAGVMETPEGVDDARGRMSDHASRHHMITALANYGSGTGGFEGGGKSAIWDEEGVVISSAEPKGDALVLANKFGNECDGMVLEI
jgi:predicted amidohydrolase